MINTALITEARKLDAEVTPGEWKSTGPVSAGSGSSIVVSAKENYVARLFTPTGPIGCNSRSPSALEAEANAAFIARARTLLPQLADALVTTDERAASYEKALREIMFIGLDVPAAMGGGPYDHFYKGQAQLAISTAAWALDKAKTHA